MSSTGKNRCTSVTAGGKPCGAPPRAGTDRCFQHGASPEERSEAGRLGALVLRSRRQVTKLEQAVGQAAVPLPAGTGAFSTAAQTIATMEDAAAKLERRELAPAQVHALAALAKIALDLARLRLDTEALEELRRARAAQEVAGRRPRKVVR